MRCPQCGERETRVVDSRDLDDSATIRRRRECAACSMRFTTYERVEEVPLQVVKRSGEREPFQRSKIVAGIRAATKNRPVTDQAIDALAAAVEEDTRLLGPAPTSDQIGLLALEALRHLDEVAYLRFASVYKGFEDVADFERELGLLTESDGGDGARS